MQDGRMGDHPAFGSLCFCLKLAVVLNVVLVLFDHLLHHLTADRACLTGGEIAVVALLQVDTDFRSGLHLELVHGGLCLGNDNFISCHFNLHSVALRRHKNLTKVKCVCKLKWGGSHF